MSGGRLGRVVLGAAAITGAVVLVRALRGPAAPQFANHPSVSGGPAPEPTPAIDPTPADGPVLELAAPEPPAGELAAPEPPAGELAAGAPAVWVEPEDGGCPEGYPIKAKLKSGIYHQPGGLAYDRTRPDRCYPDPASAEADGLRAAKR